MFGFFILEWVESNLAFFYKFDNCSAWVRIKSLQFNSFGGGFTFKTIGIRKLIYFCGKII